MTGGEISVKGHLGDNFFQTYVFAYDFLQGVRQNFPRENLHVLLDIARFGSGESHDSFEEFFAVGLGLGYGEGPEAFQVSANAVLFLHCETNPDKRLQEINGVHTGDEAFILAVPEDAADADTIGGTFLEGDRLEIGMNGATALSPSELH